MTPLEQAKGDVAAQVKVLDLKPGDVLAVTVGITNMGEGNPPWIPGTEELESLAHDLELILPPSGVRVLVYHQGLHFEIIRGMDSINVVQVAALPPLPERPA